MTYTEPNKGISIHALLAESDVTAPEFPVLGPGISIHALLAESDQFFSAFFQQNRKFLSTLSLRRATFLEQAILNIQHISIHALLAESDIFAL